MCCINDSDIEFASVMFLGADSTTTLSSSTVVNTLDHLQTGQRQQLIALLDEFGDFRGYAWILRPDQ